jgi:hypothetical protein
VNSSIGLLARIMVGVILLGGSVSKLLAFRWFVKTLASYKLVPEGMVTLSALAVVLGELVVGTLAIAGKLQPWTSYSAVGLFACFTVALVVNLVRGRFDLKCGCHGLWKKDRVGWQLVFRNLGLSGLALLALVRTEQSSLLLSVALFTLALVLSLSPFLLRFGGFSRQ